MKTITNPSAGTVLNGNDTIYGYLYFENLTPGTTI
jgi:hypothetical protein